MTALWITGGIILFFVLLLLSPLKIGISYCGDVTVVAKYLFFSLAVWSSEDKPKKASKKKTDKKTKKKKTDSDPEKQTKKRPPLKLIIETVKDILAKLFEKLKKHLKLEKATVKITVAHEDPAVAAVMYGGISGACGNLYAFLQGLKKRSKKKNSVCFEINPDFIADNTDAFFELIISSPLIWWLSVAVTAGTGLIKLKEIFSQGEPKKQKNSAERNMNNERNAIETDN